MQRIEPQEGQESVWDYPRPPRLEPAPQRLRVVFNGVTIADSERGYRVLETSSPPTYYIPRDDVQTQYLTNSQSRSVCEWKGGAVYWNIEVDGKHNEDAGWSYPDPVDRFAGIKDYITSPSILDGWTHAMLATNRRNLRMAASTVAGLPATLLARSRARPAASIGKFLRGCTDG